MNSRPGISPMNRMGQKWLYILIFRIYLRNASNWNYSNLEFRYQIWTSIIDDMNYYNEKMFHLTENVVWDDNFKRPLKVYTKPRSLIEVHSYLYMHKILALWIYCYLVHRTVIFYVTTYLFHISIKIYIYISIHKVRLSSFMHVCKYSYVITDNINQISVTIYMRPITKTLRKADFLLFQILTTIRFDELFSC